VLRNMLSIPVKHSTTPLHHHRQTLSITTVKHCSPSPSNTPPPLSITTVKHCSSSPLSNTEVTEEVGRHGGGATQPSWCAFRSCLETFNLGTKSDTKGTLGRFSSGDGGAPRHYHHRHLRATSLSAPPSHHHHQHSRHPRVVRPQTKPGTSIFLSKLWQGKLLHTGQAS